MPPKTPTRVEPSPPAPACSRTISNFRFPHFDYLHQITSAPTPRSSPSRVALVARNSFEEKPYTHYAARKGSFTVAVLEKRQPYLQAE